MVHISTSSFTLWECIYIWTTKLVNALNLRGTVFFIMIQATLALVGAFTAARDATGQEPSTVCNFGCEAKEFGRKVDAGRDDHLANFMEGNFDDTRVASMEVGTGNIESTNAVLPKLTIIPDLHFQVLAIGDMEVLGNAGK